MAKNLLNRYLAGRDLTEDFNRPARNFRKVLQAVERGEEELGETAPSARYHFQSPADVDMDLPAQMFISRSQYGSMAESDFAERLKERLGLYDDAPDPDSPSEPSQVDPPSA